MIAVMNGNKECVDLLLEKGADPNASDKVCLFELFHTILKVPYTPMYSCDSKCLSPVFLRVDVVVGV